MPPRSVEVQLSYMGPEGQDKEELVVSGVTGDPVCRIHPGQDFVVVLVYDNSRLDAARQAVQSLLESLDELRALEGR